MSGGSYNYICYRLEEECGGRMHDIELNDLIADLCKVLHAVEWWQSGDTCEETYRETVEKFKKKWFGGDRKTRLKGYIDKQTGLLREELLQLIGETEYGEK